MYHFSRHAVDVLYGDDMTIMLLFATTVIKCT